MAYMSQERKAKLAPKIKAVLAKYKLKGTLSVHNHSALSLTIKSGPIDFMTDWFTFNSNPMKPMADHQRPVSKPSFLSVNPYWIHEHYSPNVAKVLTEIKIAMNEGNHDNSDAMTDYFDVGWYAYINIGKWNKPYQLTK